MTVAGVERALELVGIVAFAISGGLLAVRKGFDLVGVLVLSVVTALGGGAIRDVLLGDTPPAAITDEWYLTLSCVTGLGMMVGIVGSIRRCGGSCSCSTRPAWACFASPEP